MAEARRTLLVKVACVREVAETLTSYGTVLGIDHEGTITWQVQGPGEFELGRLTAEVEDELLALRGGDVSIDLTRASREVPAKPK